MKNILITFCFLFSYLSYSQSGTHTKTPKATLDVRAKDSTGNSPEGIIVPNLTGDVLHTADEMNSYGVSQNGTLIYVTQEASINNRVGQTIDIDSKGYYYYDEIEDKWIKTFPNSNTTAQIGTLVCNSAILSNTIFVEGISSSGTIDISYTNGNGKPYNSIFYENNGFIFVLPAGVLAQGNGTLTYYVSGVPSITGQLALPIRFSDKSCSLNINVGLSANVESLNCSTSKFTPIQITENNVLTGTYTVSYTNGNGGRYSAQSFTLNGLTFSLSAGTLSNGNGSIVYNVSGVLSSTVPVNVPITIGDKTCFKSLEMRPMIDTINCEDFTTLISSTGTYAKIQPYPTLGTSVSNTTLTITYKGGNGVAYPTGAPFTYGGLTFTLQAGILASGDATGTLVYKVTGTPNVLSIDVPINFYGKECIFYIGLQSSIELAIKGRIWKRHNLGASTSLNADVIATGINGNYYQWGRSAIVATPSTSINAITGWSTVPYPDINPTDGIPDANPNQLWIDRRRSNTDPCPVGFKVPSLQDVENLLSQSISSGTWVNNKREFILSNGSSHKLTFPAAGHRSISDGTLYGNGTFGNYWTSSTTGVSAMSLNFNSSYAKVYGRDRVFGFPIRCISAD